MERKKQEIKNSMWVFAEKGNDAKIYILLPNGIEICKRVGKATQAQADHMAMQEAMEVLTMNKGKVKLYIESALVYGELMRGWKIKKNEELARNTKKRFKNLMEKIDLTKIKKQENYARKKIKTCKI